MACQATIVPWTDRKRRKLAARMAANERWARASQHDRQAQSAKMAEGKRAKWAKEIDPDGTLSADELTQQLANRQQAEMARLTLARKPQRGDDGAA